MKRTLLAALTLVPLLPLLTLPTAQAQSDDLICSGTLNGRTLNRDVKVRNGATCTLVGTRLTGDSDIEVERGGTLIVRNSTVNGDIQGDDGFRAVTVTGSVINGDIELERGGNVLIENVRVNGDISLEGNTGTVRLTRVTVGGDLECEDNRTAPTGGSNRVNGDREGQCRTL